jgi:hypothetical protein
MFSLMATVISSTILFRDLEYCFKSCNNSLYWSQTIFQDASLDVLHIASAYLSNIPGLSAINLIGSIYHLLQLDVLSKFLRNEFTKTHKSLIIQIHSQRSVPQTDIFFEKSDKCSESAIDAIASIVWSVHISCNHLGT